MIGKEQKVSKKGEPLDWNSKQQMNSCKKKLKKQTTALKQLKNVLLVTWDSPDGYLYDTCFKMA